MAALGRKHLLLYGELAVEFMDSLEFQKTDYIRWKVSPKHHALQHCLDTQVSVCGNPTLVWNYSDESFIGDMTKVCEQVNPMWIHRALIDRYRI